MNFVVTTPEPMWRMRVLTAKDHATETLVALQRFGVMHPKQSSVLGEVEQAAIERARNSVNGLLAEIEDVLAYVPDDEIVDITTDAEVFLTRPVDEIADRTRQVCRTLAAMHRRADQIEEERNQWKELAGIVRELGHRPDLSTADFDFTGKHLYSRLTVWTHEEFEDVREQLDLLSFSQERISVGEKVAVVLIGARDHLAELEEMVSHHGRFLTAAGTEQYRLDVFVERAETELDRLAGEHATVKAEIESSTHDELEELVLLREALKAESDRLALLAMACESRHITLFEGWVPESAVEEVSAGLREEIGCVFIETARADTQDSPPSRLRNPAALRPFETIIHLFSTPRYGNWDPTPVVAYSFALFFGLMLGDAVYGALLMLIALFALQYLVDDPETEGFLSFRKLLVICAGGAMVMGVLKGSYLGDFLQHFFGIPELALSQTLKNFYLEPMLFIIASLGIGLVHVNLGHFLMLIRGVRERLAHAIIGRLALFALQLAALPWILRLLGVELPLLDANAYSLLLGLIAMSVALIIVASVLERGAFLGSILWVFDVSGILGDVMSYARLAGVGLATFFLAYSFNMMATLVAGMFPEGLIGLVLSTITVVLILLFGHLLNLLLSSITCFVHALRLCFVEFLFKFYDGGGHPYAPFRLRRRTQLPVRTGSDGG